MGHATPRSRYGYLGERPDSRKCGSFPVMAGARTGLVPVRDAEARLVVVAAPSTSLASCCLAATVGIPGLGRNQIGL
jgi:hypothetical protein